MAAQRQALHLRPVATGAMAVAERAAPHPTGRVARGFPVTPVDLAKAALRKLIGAPVVVVAPPAPAVMALPASGALVEVG